MEQIRYNDTIFSDITRKIVSKIANSFVLDGNVFDYVFEDKNLIKHIYMEYVVNGSLYQNQTLSFKDILIFDSVYGLRSIYKKQKMEGSLSRTCDILMDKVRLSGTPESNNVIIIYLYPEVYLSDTQTGRNDNNVVMLHNIINSESFIASDNACFIITESAKDISKRFLSSGSRTHKYEISYPDFKAREDFTRFCYTIRQKALSHVEYLTPLKSLPSLTAGLTLTAIEEIFLESQLTGKLTREQILSKKDEVISKEFNDVLEILDSKDYNIDMFAGQDHIKKYFKDVVIHGFETMNKNLVPKGILFAGPPGTGKTFFARCFAGSSGINFINLNMSKIMDKYVGESEKRLTKAFNLINALAPVGVFIDEIDQVLGRGKSDNTGVRQAIFGQFLTELSKKESKGKVIFIAATNYPNTLDEALKRPGRFDVKIPFLAPTIEDRKDIFRVHLKGKVDNDGILSDEFLSRIVEDTEGFTGAEIENIIAKAFELSYREGLERITFENILKAKEFLYIQSNDKIKEMEEIALFECNDFEFIPGNKIDEFKRIKNKSNVFDDIKHFHRGL